MRLENKVAIVTGGSTGIGAATAVCYAREGAKIVIADVNETAGRRTAESIEAEGGVAQFVRTDVSQEADVVEMMAAVEQNFGRLNVLVTCAGILLSAGTRIEQFEAEAWDKVIAVNLRGTFLCTKHAVPLMEASGGVILLIASGAGVTGPSASVAYGASKGGVRGLGFTLKSQLEPLNIRVHVVCPGNLDTPLKLGAIAEMAEKAGESPEAAMAAAHPSLFKPAEVATVLADLASAAGANAEELIFTK